MIAARELERQIQEATDHLESRLGGRRPRVGLILGSGLGATQLGLTDPITIDVTEVPHLPTPTVAGHRADWTVGGLGGVLSVAAGGRVHGYEGEPLSRATLPVRVLHRLGCHTLVVTNSAGGLRADLGPGTLMRISDHLNLMARSPLVGPHDESWGDRFVDLTRAYDQSLGRIAEEAARDAGFELANGVYAGVLGPQYETPAEIRYLRTIGADAVGMSTVPEVIVARQLRMRVFGLSLISNAAAGLGDTELSHEEVLAAGREAQPRLATVVTAVVAAAGATEAG